MCCNSFSFSMRALLQLFWSTPHKCKCFCNSLSKSRRILKAIGRIILFFWHIKFRISFTENQKGYFLETIYILIRKSVT